ncbi:MAG: hypothetical protein KDN05_01200 [Verrucomicrobiae bacterium]|nr:hypothetical protein [Verrucomicrobiae bacterium]MCP5543177.1 hypothetical protein [Akkermansiaceae bacterium]
MKLTHLAVGFFLTALPAAAQNVRAEPEEDPVQAAIREFNQRDKSKPNEVTVVLDAPKDEPVLVTGKPPADAVGKAKEVSEEASEPEPADEESATVEEPPAGEPAELAEAPVSETTPKGLTVRVQELRTGTGAVDSAKVKLAAPFPAKPLARPPSGWKLVESPDAPTLTREVDLGGGSTITLDVKPHVLVPEDDGASVFAVAEPGFDNSLGYAQDATVGAILTGSMKRMDEDSKRLGQVVDQLQQLLVSLPKPEESPEPPANPNQRKP